MTSINNQTNTGNLTNGQIIIGSTGAIPVAGTISQGAGIVVTNGAGTITISSAAAPQLAQNTSAPDAYYLQWPGVLLGNPATNTQTSGDKTNLLNDVLFMPFFVSSTYTPSNIYIVVDGVLAASTMNLGLYASNANGYQPSGSATNIVNPSTATTGKVTTAWTPTLTANTIYWLGIQCSTATTMSLVAYTMNPNVNVGPGTGANSQTSGSSTDGALLWTQTNSFSAGSMPTVSSLAATSIFAWPIVTYL